MSDNKRRHLSTTSCAPIDVADVCRILERTGRVQRQGRRPRVVDNGSDHYTDR